MKVSPVISLKQLLTFILLSIMISGCTVVGPNYQRPSVNLPSNFKEATANNIMAKPEPSSKLDPRWWRIYRDEYLNQLMQQLQQQNFSLAAAAAQMQQAQSTAKIAQASQSATVDAGGRNDFGFLANWEIDLWGGIKRKVEASEATAQASKADYAAVKLSLQAQLAQSYALIRIQDSIIDLLDNTIASYRRSLTIAHNQYKVGIVDEGTVAQAQAQLSSTETQRYDARIIRAQLEHTIAVLIGKNPANFTLAKSDIPMIVPRTPLLLPSELLLRRPDIAAAERKMAAASAQIGVAEAAAYPSFNIFAGASIKDELIGGGELLIPLYRAGSLKALSHKARAVFEQVVANYRQTVLNSFLEVEDNLVTLNMLNQAAATQKKAVEANRKSVQITKNQFKVGIVNYQSIVIEETKTLINERIDLNILSRRLLASISLIKSLGGNWQSPFSIKNKSEIHHTAADNVE